MIDLDRDGSVFVLTMQAGENRFNGPFLDALNRALDTVEASSGPAALVTTGGQEKFYSTGLDLDWLGGDGQHEAAGFVESVIALFARVAGLGVPTIAAMNGHAFAAGGMLALAHDFRVMRADRGFFCLNEVDIGLPLHPGMVALVKHRLPAGVLRDVVLTGARIGGAEACQRGIVDEAVPAADVLPAAIARAAALAQKDRQTYAALKRGIQRDLLEALTKAL
ncbi:MAG TPA: enoyl-CoA hydratase-related protein [Miltoncostaeaceae bacterium]|nr:enoyl-CoA hydratase-related protein [Miltoncostaeaceae bacterium]